MPLSANQQWEEVLDPAKGWFQASALDYAADLAAAVTIRVPAGAVMHLDSSGNFVLGVASRQMAIFALQASDSPDVSISGTTSAGRFVSQSILPSGRRMSGLVATGGYEIKTTCFDTTKTYAPNELLTAATGNTAGRSGVLCNDAAGAGVSGTGPVLPYLVVPSCGVVSSGAALDEWGVSKLAFWPIYLPV